MLATRAIAEYAAGDPAEVVRALVRSDPQQWEILFPVAEQMQQSVWPLLVKQLHTDAADSLIDNETTEAERDAHASRRANAAVALVRFGQADEVWPLLEKTEDCRLRTYLIHRWKPLGVSPETLLQQLDRTQDVSQRRALLLSLGTFALGKVFQAAGGEAAGRKLIGRVERMLREHPDAGVHGAARWLLTQWGHEELVAAAMNELAGQGVAEGRQWYVHPEKLTLVNVREPAAFWMGSGPTEPYRDPDESRHLRHIDRGFSVAATEITRRQFDRFLQANPDVQSSETSKYSPSPSSPRVVVTWFEAAAFCNWLSQQEGLPKDQWCYPVYHELTEGRPLPANWLRRTGYRLPTEAEWEYACRAGAVTPRYYGHDESLLHKYAWYLGTGERVQPVAQLMPNDFGLFDMHGNAWEWCGDLKEPYATVELSQVVRDRVVGGAVSADENRVLRSGGITSGPRYIRCADRSWYPADYLMDVAGFRPARTVPAE